MSILREKQQRAAKKAMISWLEDPSELGKTPAKIECTGEFDLHGLHYYIYKFKKNFTGDWLMGVCGGYEGEELENCGHVFSEMKKYDSLIIGHITKDFNIDHLKNLNEICGGAVLFSSASAFALGTQYRRSHKACRTGQRPSQQLHNSAKRCILLVL